MSKNQEPKTVISSSDGQNLCQKKKCVNNDSEETRKIVQNKTMDEERALYGSKHIKVINCIFKGPADGESPLKESDDVIMENCDFQLRYPMWHLTNSHMNNSKLTAESRAAFWYDRNLKITNSVLGGIKVIRECDDTTLENCKIDSKEFAWMSRDIVVNNCQIKSEYPFLKSKKISMDKVFLDGKYSFQYAKDVKITNSKFITKDMLWHAKNVVIEDSVLEGEYPAWYSENVTLRRCKINGTQPFCYCKGLVLEDCEMVNCDLSFEKSEVKATLLGKIHSIKNPESGKIVVDEVGELIQESKTSCIVEIKKRK